MSEVMKTRELELEQAHEERQMGLQDAMVREEQDKDYILTVQSTYQNELEKLRLEKDLIVDQSNQFARNLQTLTQEYDYKSHQVLTLQDETQRLRAQMADIER